MKKEKVNVKAFLKGCEELDVQGSLLNKKIRLSLVEEAIFKIQQDPKEAFKNDFIGTSTYAAFKEERFIAGYENVIYFNNMIIRFFIKKRSKKPFSKYAIYALEVLREFSDYDGDEFSNVIRDAMLYKKKLEDANRFFDMISSREINLFSDIEGKEDANNTTVTKKKKWYWW